MSMNFSEFKTLMGTDPLNKDAETELARNSSSEFEAAAVEAEAFEKKIQAAMNIQPPGDLLNDIKAISQQPVKRRNWVPMALAASLLIAVSAVTIVWQQSRSWDSVEAYLADHYSDDGSALLSKVADPVSEQDINRIMAKLDAYADQQLSGQITYIQHCPTPDGRGAHIIVSTDQGPMTIIFMPETQVTDGEMVEFDQMHALLVNLDHGSAAIIGALSQPLEGLEATVRASLKTGLVGA